MMKRRKRSHESELFADSEDSHIKRIDNIEDNRNPNQDPNTSNIGRIGNDHIDQSLIMGQRSFRKWT